MFYDDRVFLHSDLAYSLYKEVRDLPIIDYHCHLDQNMIKDDVSFNDIGELWLAKDHYKWRAMRMCGVDENYITGNASYHDKFIKYASILPNLISNPLYHWTHLELKEVFGINRPLNKDTAEEIYVEANNKLKELSTRKLLKKFNVEFISTTDDPSDDLLSHGVYDGIKITPTFRPDKIYDLSGLYIGKLEKSANKKIVILDDLLSVLSDRLDYFVSKGCRMSDHGFTMFPKHYASLEEARKLFINRDNLTAEEKDAWFGFILVWLTKEYAKRGINMQIHFAVVRNNNIEMFDRCGVDSGFDLIGEPQSISDLINYFNQVKDEERPLTILYSLNDSNLAAIAAVTGAFKNVRMGAAWWFNDTEEGIRRNLKIISEYSILGNNLGMLTDSRSFSSYPRFDYFRRILCDFVADKVNGGEYDEKSAIELVKNICYYNAKKVTSND